MISPSTITYYLSSIPSLLFGLNFWLIPFIFIKKPLLITLHSGLKFYVWNLMDVWVLKEIIIEKQYALYGKAKKTWIIVDIGAGIGEFDILLSKDAKHIYAFEMDENRIKLAKKNIQLNQNRNITYVGEEVKDLGEILEKYRIKKCHLLKIDCEGNEYPILASTSKKTFRKVERIIMEIHLFNSTMRKKYSTLQKHLKENNFTLKICNNPVHDYLKLLYAQRNDL